MRTSALAALLSSCVAGTWADLAVFAAVLLVTLVSRLAALPRPVDLDVGSTWMIAGSANAPEWYLAHPWLDIPVHATTPGSAAAATYLLLARARLVSGLQATSVGRTDVVVLTLTVGTSLAVWWESSNGWPIAWRRRHW